MKKNQNSVIQNRSESIEDTTENLNDQENEDGPSFKHISVADVSKEDEILLEK